MRLQKEHNSFMCNRKHPRIQNKIMIQDYIEDGLVHVYSITFMKTQAIVCVKRLLEIRKEMFFAY